MSGSANQCRFCIHASSEGLRSSWLVLNSPQAVGIPAARPPKLYTAHLSGRDGRGRDGVPIVLGDAAAPDSSEEEVYWLPKPWASAPTPAEVRCLPRAPDAGSHQVGWTLFCSLRGCMCLLRVGPYRASPIIRQRGAFDLMPSAATMPFVMRLSLGGLPLLHITFSCYRL